MLINKEERKLTEQVKKQIEVKNVANHNMIQFLLEVQTLIQSGYVLNVKTNRSVNSIGGVYRAQLVKGADVGDAKAVSTTIETSAEISAKTSVENNAPVDKVEVEVVKESKPKRTTKKEGSE